jgi:hypothetical protein
VECLDESRQDESPFLAFCPELTYLDHGVDEAAGMPAGPCALAVSFADTLSDTQREMTV